MAGFQTTLLGVPARARREAAAAARVHGRRVATGPAVARPGYGHCYVGIRVQAGPELACQSFPWDEPPGPARTPDEAAPYAPLPVSPAPAAGPASAAAPAASGTASAGAPPVAEPAPRSEGVLDALLNPISSWFASGSSAIGGIPGSLGDVAAYGKRFQSYGNPLYHRALQKLYSPGATALARSPTGKALMGLAAKGSSAGSTLRVLSNAGSGFGVAKGIYDYARATSPLDRLQAGADTAFSGAGLIGGPVGRIASAAYSAGQFIDSGVSAIGNIVSGRLGRAAGAPADWQDYSLSGMAAEGGVAGERAAVRAADRVDAAAAEARVKDYNQQMAAYRAAGMSGPELVKRQNELWSQMPTQTVTHTRKTTGYRIADWLAARGIF